MAHPVLSALLALVLLIAAVSGGGSGGPSVSAPSPSSTASPSPTSPIPSPSPTSVSPTPTEGTPSATASPSSTSRTRLATDVLATLAVKGRAPKTGYDRTGKFGEAWDDGSGRTCNTRERILARDLFDITYKPGSCKVATGVLHDPYTGTTIHFVRGQGTSTAVQIDHVVALSDAWQKGAQQWDRAKRVAFANDPDNLLAVDGPTNQQKGDGDAATWLPPNRSFRCAYVARQIGVKAGYGLWVTRAEKDAMARVLAGCPGQVVVGGSAGAVTAAASTPTVTTTSAPTGAPTTVQGLVGNQGPGSGSDVYYKNCAAARAAGAAPIRKGRPGYRAGLDRDGDGVACE